MRKEKIFLILCIFLALSIRTWVLLNTDHLDFESYGRIIFAHRFVEHPFQLLHGIDIIQCGTGGQQWFYFLTCLLINLFGHHLFVPRILSLFFGILTVFFYYHFIKTSFSIKIAALSVIILIFYPIHIQLSVVTMANAGFLFFTVLACLFLNFYLSSQNYRKRIIFFFFSILFTNLAASFRLEGWLLVGVLPLILFLEKKRKQSFIFFIFSSLYILRILFLFHSSYNTFGFLTNSLFNPDCSFKMSNFFATRIDMPFYAQYQRYVWTETLCYTFSLPLFTMGLIGMLTAYKNTEQRRFLILFWSFFILLTLRQIISNQYPYIRYSAVLALFFIPFIFLGIINISKIISQFFRLKLSYRNTLTTLFLTIAISYYIIFSVQFLHQELPKMKLSKFVSQLAELVKENTKEGDIVFSSLDALTLNTTATLNNFISLDILWTEENTLSLELPTRNYNLFNYIQDNSKIKISKDIYKELFNFAEKINEVLPGEGLNIRLFIQRGISYKIKRLIFLFPLKDFNSILSYFPKSSWKFKILDKKTVIRNAKEKIEFIVAIFEPKSI